MQKKKYAESSSRSFLHHFFICIKLQWLSIEVYSTVKALTEGEDAFINNNTLAQTYK